MLGEVPPGYGGSPEPRAVNGSLSSAGQLYPCPAAQPRPQSEPGGMSRAHVLPRLLIDKYIVTLFLVQIFNSYILQNKNIHTGYIHFVFSLHNLASSHKHTYTSSLTAHRPFFAHLSASAPLLSTIFSFISRMRETRNLKNDPTPGTRYWTSTAKFCPEFRGSWQWKEPNLTSIRTLSTEKVRWSSA